MTTSAMRKIVASVLGAILALTGVLITPAAWAAGPTVTVIPVGREGGDITINQWEGILDYRLRCLRCCGTGLGARVLWQFGQVLRL